MTWVDPIVEEVRRIRDAYAAQFNYDIRAMCRDLQEQEKRSGREIVSFEAENVPQSPLIGLGAGPGEPPSDETVRQWIDEHRMDKYGS